MYLDFFKLKEKPFNVTPDPHFLFMSPGHQEAFANLLYGIRERKGFTVLTGEVGTGKTTLLHSLLSTLEEEIQTVYIFHTGLDFDQMLMTVHRELGIKTLESTRGGLIASLNAYLIDQLRRDRNVALIIDEAQNLSTEFLENLRLLSNLETAKEKLLQIVLVGQPELEAKLGLTELRQLESRVMVRSRIEPLSPTDSEAYLHHRLSLAGAGDEPIIEPEALALICRRGGGNPRRLNLLADNSMLVAYAEGERRVKVEHVRECLRDFERQHPAGPARTSRAASGARLPWALFAALTALTLIYLSYEFGRRQRIERLSPQSIPSASLAEDLPLSSPPEQAAFPAARVFPPLPAAQDQPRTEEIASLDAAFEASGEASTVKPAPNAVERHSPRSFPRAISLEQIREALAVAPRIAYRVQLGDQFNALTERFCGRSDSNFLIAVREMNPHVQDFDHILPGWILFFPDPEVDLE